jgi:hypothetical protein
MNKKSQAADFFENLKKQKWLIPVLIIIFLILLGSMIFLSEDSFISPTLYQKF